MSAKSKSRSLQSPHLAEAVDRNIKALMEVRRQMEKNKNPGDKLANRITMFSGSMIFVYLHIAWFGIWIAVNLGFTEIAPFDPFPFGLLTMIVSLEAIFLSAFVLISQNRMAEISDKRADLDLHINLLAEYEITKILRLVDAIADHLKLKEGSDPELVELEEEVHPQSVLRAIEAREKAKR